MEREEREYKEGIAYGLWAGWLFGFGGLHRLYLGKYVTGFLWLVTWGLLGIGQLVDLITLHRQVRDANLLAEARAARSRGGEVTTAEQKLLRAAIREGGVLTVTQAVQATGLSFQRAEGLLREMVTSGYVDVDNAPESGVVIYRFPELEEARRVSHRTGRRRAGDTGASGDRPI